MFLANVETTEISDIGTVGTAIVLENGFVVNADILTDYFTCCFAMG